MTAIRMKKRTLLSNQIGTLRARQEIAKKSEVGSKVFDKEATSLWSVLFGIKDTLLGFRRLHDDGND